jgi:hypothetical protein
VYCCRVAIAFLQFHFGGPDYELPHRYVIPVLFVAAIPGFLFSLWFSKKMLNKQYWQLTDSELSCGIHGQQKFPLASIEKIIVGLPPMNAVLKVLQRAKPGTALGTSVDVLSAVDPRWNTLRNLALASAEKENSMLICFKDGSMLPLRLYLFPNGKTLMDALKERCKDRVVQSYDYTPEDIRRLRRRDVNELIPAPKR